MLSMFRVLFELLKKARGHQDLNRTLGLIRQASRFSESVFHLPPHLQFLLLSITNFHIGCNKQEALHRTPLVSFPAGVQPSPEIMHHKRCNSASHCQIIIPNRINNSHEGLNLSASCSNISRIICLEEKVDKYRYSRCAPHPRVIPTFLFINSKLIKVH